MRKNKKRVVILLIIISISMISYLLTRNIVKQSIIKIVAQYQTAKASTTEDGRFEYRELSDGTIEITKYVGTDTVVEIPSTIAGKNVTSIGWYAFSGCRSLTNIAIPAGVTSIGLHAFNGCSSLTNITIPEGVTSINTYAFYGCSSLTNITIPKGVTSIDRYVFSGCSSLTDITIPEGVTSIRERAFSGCSSLTDIKIPEGVTSIGDGAFSGCSSLTDIKIPEGVTSIGDDAFSKCSSLTDIKIPEGVTSIGWYAFSGCSSLGNITIPKGVTSIGLNAFYGCSSLTNITIPEGVTSIGERAFAFCSSLTNITIPEGVTSIGESAFSECSSLTNITIPEGVTSIGERAFAFCSSLTNITVDSNNKNYCDIDGVLYTKDKTKIFKYPAKRNTTQYNIPKGVTSIGSHAFEYCSSLTEITIPEGVTSIGWYAFSGCSSLGNITIPEGVTSIGGYAFSGCSSLGNITIPEGVTGISSNAFNRCSSLTNIKIPEGVTSIGSHAFEYCSSLTDIKIPEGVKSIGDCAFQGCSNLTNIKIPEGVTSIGRYAFNGCRSLTEIAILEGVTSIGEATFQGCSNLINIKIPEGVTSIGRYAFNGCRSLTEIAIPEGVTSIGEATFQGCSNLTNITIPEGVTSIDSSAFFGCSSKLIIYCKSNTTAEQYAKEKNILYVIDDEKPTCTITADKTSPTNASSITYTFTFSEKVTEFKEEDVIVSIGNKGEFTKVSETVYTCTILNEGEIPGTDQKVSIEEGICSDMVGNANEAASKTIRIDTVAPTVTITADKTSPTNASSITYTFTFSEEVIGFTKEDITVTNGIEGTFTGSGNTYTLVVTNIKSCIQTISIASGVCTDIVGNKNTSAMKEITIDTVNPTCTITASESNLTNANSITYTFTFSEEVKGFTKEDIKVTNGEKGEFTTISSKIYTLEVANTESCIQEVSILEGICTDLAGNNNTRASISITVDVTEPTCIITASEPNLTNARNITYTFTFSEEVKGFTKEDIKIINGTIASFSGIGKIYTLDVTNSEDGTQEVVILEGICTDLAGNSNVKASISITVDRTEPTCIITTSEENPTKANSVTYTFEFSEEVKVFLEENIKVTNGEKGEFTTISSKIYTLEVANTESCIQEVEITEGACTDLAGNVNKKASKSITIDRINPTAGTLTMKLENGEEYENNTWTTENVLISINNGTDEHSGHKSTVYTINGGTETVETQTLTESGTYEIVVTTTDNAGNTVTNTYIVKIRRAKSIEITTNPIKLAYLAGEEFDSTGMEVSVIYDNKDKEKTTEYTIVNWPYSLKCGMNKIEIQYNNNPEIKTELEVEAQHIEEILTQKEPTCTEKGLTEGKHCEICKTVLEEQKEIQALGHSFTNYTSDGNATCTQDGTKTGTCERCGMTDTQIDVGSKIPHREVIGKGKPATCTQTGLTEGKHCEICKAVIVEQKEIPALGHSFTNYTSDGNATCTQDGTKTAKCERCEVTDTQTEVGSILPHTEVIDKGKAATCTEKGLTDGKHCEICKTVIEEQKEIPALGHSFTNYTSDGNATCTKDGTKTAKCDRCDEIDTQTEIGSKIPHKEVKVAGKAATCTEKGLTDGKHCEICKTVIEEQKEIPALGHSFTNYTSDGNATCTKDGTKTAKCDRCDAIDTQTEIGSKIPHKEVKVAGKAATCTEKGLTEGKHCEICKAVIVEQKEISALGHNYEEKVTSPNCLEKGYTTHTCTRCKDSYIDTYTDTLGHSFTNYTSDGNATCTKDGTKTAKCDRCDVTNTQTDVGSKLPHTEVIDKGKAATCTAKGLTEGKHCEICKTVLVEQKEISALGHNYKEKVTSPNCLEKGYTTHTCTRCKDSYIDTYTDALGHSFTNYTSDGNATCSQDGTKTAKCERCEVTDTQTDVGSKIPHKYINQECTMCKQKEPKIEITSEKFKIENQYISQIEPKTTIKDLKENIRTNATEIKIYDKDQVVQDENETLKTGMQLQLKYGNEKETYIIVINGDLNCDGKANILDMVVMNRHRLNKKILEGEYLIAGDVTGDNKIDIIDIVKINKYRLNKITQILENIIK